MSIESAKELTAEQQAAFDLIRGSEILKNDPYARRVVESGKADSGIEVDLGDFLAAREAVLQLDSAEQKVAAAKSRNPQAWEVANSVRPDLEEK